MILVIYDPKNDELKLYLCGARTLEDLLLTGNFPSLDLFMSYGWEVVGELD